MAAKCAWRCDEASEVGIGSVVRRGRVCGCRGEVVSVVGFGLLTRKVAGRTRGNSVLGWIKGKKREAEVCELTVDVTCIGCF